MSKYAKSAKRYVKAYFELARETGKLKEAAADMELIAKTVSENQELKNFLKQPIIGSEQKYKAVKKIFGDKVSGLTQRLLALLAQKNRMDILEDIAKLFGEYYKKHLGVVEAVLTTAIPVDDEVTKAFHQKVKELTGKDNAVLKTETDPSIIGGYILQIGDLKIDDSVKGKLNKIKSNLLV
jgi:F-type H+-transporting ATPase subunit delta